MTKRRRFMKMTATGIGTALIAGCASEENEPADTAEGDVGDDDESENGEDDANGDENGEENGGENGGENGDEDIDSDEALEDEDIESTVDGLEILEHSFYEDDFEAGVEGIVANNTGDELSYVEVGVVFYNEDDQRISDSFTNTTDLTDGEEWVFDVPLLGADAEDVDSYNIAVTDSPF